MAAPVSRYWCDQRDRLVNVIAANARSIRGEGELSVETVDGSWEEGSALMVSARHRDDICGAVADTWTNSGIALVPPPCACAAHLTLLPCLSSRGALLRATVRPVAP